VPKENPVTDTERDAMSKRRPDDRDVPGHSRPFHTHPYIEAVGESVGHVHPDGGQPHTHVYGDELMLLRAARLTIPRRNAMLVLLAADADTPVTESNRTHPADPERPGLGGTVYWQVRAWAERAGYIEARMHNGRRLLSLTVKGRALAEAVDELTRQAVMAELGKRLRPTEEQDRPHG
jgi:hypothetical protein